MFHIIQIFVSIDTKLTVLSLQKYTLLIKPYFSVLSVSNIEWPRMTINIPGHKHSICLAERYYITFGLWHEPSVCCLSVTLFHPRQRLELFGNFLHRLIAQGLGQFVLKFLAKIRRVF